MSKNYPNSKDPSTLKIPHLRIARGLGEAAKAELDLAWDTSEGVPAERLKIARADKYVHGKPALDFV